MGLEVITLQHFLPGVQKVLGGLRDVNKAYRAGLSSSSTAGGQAQALERYASAVQKVVERLRRLGPPPALRPWQSAQTQRLQQIVDTARTLEKALRLRDPHVGLDGVVLRLRDVRLVCEQKLEALD